MFNLKFKNKFIIFKTNAKNNIVDLLFLTKFNIDDVEYKLSHLCFNLRIIFNQITMLMK
jgi:hypothetical protein